MQLINITHSHFNVVSLGSSKPQAIKLNYSKGNIADKYLHTIDKGLFYDFIYFLYFLGILTKGTNALHSPSPRFPTQTLEI